MRLLSLLCLGLLLYISWDATDLNAKAFWPGAGAPMLFMFSILGLMIWLVALAVKRGVKANGGHEGYGGGLGDGTYGGGDGGSDGGGDGGGC